MANIPFNKPYCAGKETEYMNEAIRRGHLSGNGSFTKRSQAVLEEALAVPKVLLTTSCTHALEMTALLAAVGPGDEVILPSFTFVSTANAFVLRGARPVFADIRPDTLNLDERSLESLITPRTRAVVPVHYAGTACEMDRILEISQKHRLTVIEDNAHGLFGSYRGKLLGTFGRMATLSFHETKNIISGEGGALLLNDPTLIERAEIIQEKGTNRSRFFRGQVDKYSWVGVGSSYVQSELLAAYLLGQLEARDRIQQIRKDIWNRYYQALGDWAARRGVVLPTVPNHVGQAYHLFYLLMPTLDMRTRFISYLRDLGIMCTFHYVPLHLSPMGQEFGGKPGDCPVTEDISERLVRLPFYNDLSEADQIRVIEAIRSFPGL